MQTTAQPQNSRYNIYSKIHKALRAFMADTLQRCGRTDWEDAADCHSTLEQIRELMTVCYSHLEHENEFLHAAMEERRPGSSTATHIDHHEHVLAIKSFLADAHAIEQTPPVLRTAVGASMYRRLALFVAENFEHMAVEETDNAAVLCACYSDEEILEIEGRIIANVPPQISPIIMRWMLPAISAQERALMLAGMRQKAPAEAFDGVMHMIRPLLGARDWDKLNRALRCESRAEDSVAA